jgi:large subunit ribosomal protein L24
MKMNEKATKSKKIRKGDKVIAIAGNYRGQTGTVLHCSGDKVIVQGLNIRKKHVKPTQQNQRGGIIELEKPIHISNLKVCTADEKPVKLKVRTDKKGERQLVYQEGSQEVLHRSLKKS